MSFNLQDFKNNLQSHIGITFSGQVTYRYVNSALLTKNIISNPLNSVYSYGRGYRFNFPYAFPTLYLALTEFVATLEAGQRPDPLSTIFDNREKEPAILYSIRVSGYFANLMDETSLKQLSLNPLKPEYLVSTRKWEEDVRKGKPGITHQIGQAVYDAGFDGIVYLSFPAWELRFKYNRDILSNICIFMSTNDPGKPKSSTCKLEIFDQDNLTEKLIK